MAEYLGIITMDSGEYYYVERQNDKLVAGGARNWGIMPEVEIEYDNDISTDSNLERLYEALQEYDYSKSA